MNFVYICRGSQNEELRYSIRSVLHHYPDSEILVVGGKPSWYIGDFIEVKNIGNKFQNITNCYKTICNIQSLDNFILMNDDFFIINKPKTIDYFYDGSIQNKIDIHTQQYGLSKYARVLHQANKVLQKSGISNPLNYDVHTPMLFNKEKLSKIVGMSDAPRSMYGNIFKVGGQEIKDVKVYKYTKGIDINQDFLSSEDNTFKVLHSLILNDMFNIKTKYEA